MAHTIIWANGLVDVDFVELVGYCILFFFGCGCCLHTRVIHMKWPQHVWAWRHNRLPNELEVVLNLDLDRTDFELWNISSVIFIIFCVPLGINHPYIKNILQTCQNPMLMNLGSKLSRYVRRISYKNNFNLSAGRGKRTQINLDFEA